jgi:hypothetical protein
MCIMNVVLCRQNENGESIRATHHDSPALGKHENESSESKYSQEDEKSTDGRDNEVQTNCTSLHCYALVQLQYLILPIPGRSRTHPPKIQSRR